MLLLKINLHTVTIIHIHIHIILYGVPISSSVPYEDVDYLLGRRSLAKRDLPSLPLPSNNPSRVSGEYADPVYSAAETQIEENLYVEFNDVNINNVNYDTMNKDNDNDDENSVYEPINQCESPPTAKGVLALAKQFEKKK